MTGRNNLVVGVLALLLFGSTLCPGAFAQNPGYQLVRLTSGKQIKLLGITPGLSDGGAPRSMTLRYQTDRSISDKKELAAEVDDIWDMFKIEVEKHGLGVGVISANAQPLGGDKFNHRFDFVLIKDASGKWQCLNDEVVGVGTPAKIAYWQGLKLAKQGRVEDALAMFNRCISLDPAYGPVYIDRGAAHLQLNQADKAVADANQALILLPDNPGVYCNRGIAYWKLNQRQKALDDFTKVVSLSPEDHLGYMNRGAALVEMGSYASGIADLTKAISINPRVARPYHNRSVAYDKLAEKDRQQAADLGHRAAQTASAGGTH